MIPDIFVLKYFRFLYTKKNSRFLKFQEVSMYDDKKTIILYLDRRQPSVSLKTTNVSRRQNQLNYACTLYTYYIFYKHPNFFRLLVKKHKKKIHDCSRCTK